jgi:hypothetical protein
MLRPFLLVSDPVTYSGGVATVTFPKKPRCRSAIVRVGFVVNSPRHLHRNLLNSFKVVGRDYVQGDPFPVSLLCAPIPAVDDLSAGTPSDALAALTNIDLLVDETTGVADDSVSAVPVPADAPVDADALREDITDNLVPVLNANFKELTDQVITQRTFNTAVSNALASLAAEAVARASYFPGSLLRMRDGRTVGGIKIKKDQKISIELQDLTTNAAPIERVILHCVEFPERGIMGRDGSSQWARFDAGQGEVMFYGHRHDYSAAGETTLSATPVPADADGPMRRLYVRGALYDASHNLKEAEFKDLLAEARTQSQQAPQDQLAPAREVIGHVCADSEVATVDLHPNESAQVRVNVPSAPGAARTLRLVQMFEGRDPADEFVGTVDTL